MPIGFRTGRVADTTRRNWDDNAPRPISWFVWYPAADGAVEQTLVLGGSDEAIFSHGATAVDAPLNSGQHRYPVVLLSHGTGGSALSLSWLGIGLARRGFIAIGVDHHGNTAVEPYRAEGFLAWWERARDLTLLLDYLSREGFLAGRLNLDRVYGAGFSLGGHTIAALLGGRTDVQLFDAANLGPRFSSGPLEFPDAGTQLDGLLSSSSVFRASWSRQEDDYRDSRIRAALLLAPAPPIRALSEESLRQIVNPVCIIVGESDTEAPADTCAAWLHERLPNSTLEVLGEDVGHYTFLAEATERGRELAPELCLDAPGVDRRRIHEATVAAALELFGS